jgi:purine-binding chemotaxis protein CheW
MDETQIVSGIDNHRITFHLGGKLFGVPLRVVEAIIAWEPPTHLPKTPDFITGLLSVRGSALPVMDLRVRLGIQASAPTPAHRILVLQLEGVRFGAIVDGVKSVERLPEERIERDIPLTTSLSNEFMEGVAHLDAELIILLKPEGVLAKKERERVARLTQ